MIKMISNYANQIKTELNLDLISNPLGPPKSVLKVIENITLENISSYRNKEIHDTLIRRLAHINSVKPGNIMLTAGADHAIEVLLCSFQKKSLGIHIPAFPRFEIVASFFNMNTDFFSDLQSIPKKEIIILCTPNNPTTIEIPKEKVISLVKTNRNKNFIIDAVFGDFGTWNPGELVNNFSNVIVIKSFSKSFGIPGARVGFVVASRKIMKNLKKLLSPFHVSNISQRIALTCMENFDHITRTKRFLEQEFKKISHLDVIRKSNVPFYLLRCEEKTAKLLSDHGINVVSAKHFRGLNDFIRVKIGTQKENQIFLDKIDHLVIL